MFKWYDMAAIAITARPNASFLLLYSVKFRFESRRASVLRSTDTALVRDIVWNTIARQALSPLQRFECSAVWGSYSSTSRDTLVHTADQHPYTDVSIQNHRCIDVSYSETDNHLRHDHFLSLSSVSTFSSVYVTRKFGYPATSFKLDKSLLRDNSSWRLLGSRLTGLCFQARRRWR